MSNNKGTCDCASGSSGLDMDNGQMEKLFEKEITEYASNIARAYTSDFVPLSTIQLEAGLPEGFRKYAEAEVDEMLDNEGIGESKTGKIDMSLPEVQTLFKEIRQLLKKSYRFSRDEFARLSNSYSSFLFDYIIMPRATIEKLLFKSGSEVDKFTVERASRLFVAYSYYQRAILEYIDFSGKGVIDKESWKKVHSRVDEHLISTLPSKGSTLTAALFDLFKFASGAEKIPVEAVTLFFKDKQASEIVGWIESAKEVKNLKSVDPITLSVMLEAAIKGPDHGMISSKTIGTSKDSTVTQERFGMGVIPRQRATIPAEVEPVKEVEAAVVPIAQPESVKARTESGIMAQHSTSMQSTPSVKSFLSDKVEIKVVKKIFGGSRSSYQVAIHRLDESPDWQTASRIVEEIFMQSEIDPFSKYAVAFTDAVNARFSKRK